MIKSFTCYIKTYRLLLSLISLFAVLVLYSCANMSSPQGGDYDFDPPVVVRTIPAMNATNVYPKKIEIYFDEQIQLENPGDKIIITPPQKKTPVIQAVGRKVTVELKDTLEENTTYTIDFTDAIADYTEKNILENFSFSFSTGSHIDTMSISGKVLSADNLEPVKGIYVGLHRNLEDSAFTQKPFDKISRTNDAGEFTIRGLADEDYKVYALRDIVRSYKYDNPEAEIAFTDEIIRPSTAKAFRSDTVFKKDLTIDTVYQVEYTQFLPKDLMLRAFNPNFKRLYMQRPDRPQDNQLKISFSAPNELPELTPLNFTPRNTDWALLERSAKNDSLLYWVVDTTLIAMDTLKFKIAYNKSDSLNNIVSQVDTIQFINRIKKVVKEDKKKKDKEVTTEFLPVSFSSGGVINLYDTVRFVFEQPVLNFDASKLSLQSVTDTIFTDETDFIISQDALNPRKYSLIHKWDPGKSYLIKADSTAFNSYTGLWTDKINNKFSVRNLDEYGDLYIGLTGLATGTTAFVELLNERDTPVRKATVRYKNDEASVLFMHLMPGKYYARIVIDANNNGVWDTGDFYTKTEPETVFYNNAVFDIRANWQKEETWDIYALPLDKQKPLEITKNKPQEKESKRKKLEKEEQKKNQKEKEERQQRNQSNSMNSLGGRSPF